VGLPLGGWVWGFRNLKILTVYSLYILETILYVKKCNYTVNEQIHTRNTRKNKDYHKYRHNLDLLQQIAK
jgi:hypothetical protein